MLAAIDPDLMQLIIAIAGAVMAFFGGKQGSKIRK